VDQPIVVWKREWPTHFKPCEVLRQRGQGPRTPLGRRLARGPRRRSWPLRATPRKRRVCREKVRGGRDPRPLGTEIGSSALARTRSTATTGAWPSPTITVAAAWGSTTAIMAPSGGPLKTVRFAGKKPQDPGGPLPLGAAMDSSAFADAKKYCHNGGIAFAPHHGRRLARGSMNGDHGPLRRSPENGRFAGRKAGGSRGPCLLGAAIDSSACRGGVK
jgi:hypothetical protein